jgi:uncharacterized protein (DUF305 family)
MRRQHSAFAALVVVAAIVMGACSSNDHDGMGGGSMQPSGSTVSIPDDAPFNATDVAFAQGMIPHHAQAVQMADMDLATSTNSTILALAEKIKGAQDPEIVIMEGWLASWGQPVPDRNQPRMDHSSDGMNGMMMSGMMSEADMARMAEARGTEFDRLFLEMMILHHEGAIEMAEQELAAGKYPPAKDLAGVIIAAQQAEIAEMNALAPTLG